jgi:hypothetical protein
MPRRNKRGPVPKQPAAPKRDEREAAQTPDAATPGDDAAARGDIPPADAGDVSGNGGDAAPDTVIFSPLSPPLDAAAAATDEAASATTDAKSISDVLSYLEGQLDAIPGHYSSRWNDRAPVTVSNVNLFLWQDFPETTETALEPKKIWLAQQLKTKFEFIKVGSTADTIGSDFQTLTIMLILLHQAKKENALIENDKWLSSGNKSHMDKVLESLMQYVNCQISAGGYLPEPDDATPAATLPDLRMQVWALPQTDAGQAVRDFMNLVIGVLEGFEAMPETRSGAQGALSAVSGAVSSVCSAVNGALFGASGPAASLAESKSAQWRMMLPHLVKLLNRFRDNRISASDCLFSAYEELVKCEVGLMALNAASSETANIQSGEHLRQVQVQLTERQGALLAVLDEQAALAEAAEADFAASPP